MFLRYHKDIRNLEIIMGKQTKIVNAVTALQSYTFRWKVNCIDNAMQGMQSLAKEYAESIEFIYDSIYTIAKTLEDTFDIKWTFCEIESIKQNNSTERLTSYMLELQNALLSVFCENSVATYTQKMAILHDCTILRNDITKLETEIKKAYCNTYPFYGKTIPLNFKKGVLVRSVKSLCSYTGVNGVNYPMLSTSVFTLDNPNWYLKDVDRNIMLVYTIPNVDSLIGMCNSDGNTSVLFDSERDSLAAAVEQLMFYDGLENDYVSVQSLDFSLGYDMQKLLHPTDSEINEILLTSSVKARAILVGGNHSISMTAEDFIKIDENYDMIKRFSLTYDLPVFTLESDNSIKERKSFRDPLCFERSLA